MIRRAASRQCLPRHARKPHEAPPIDWPRRRCAAGGLARPTTGNTGPAGRPPRGLVISRPRSWVPCGVPRIPHPEPKGEGRQETAPAESTAAVVLGRPLAGMLRLCRARPASDSPQPVLASLVGRRRLAACLRGTWGRGAGRGGAGTRAQQLHPAARISVGASGPVSQPACGARARERTTLHSTPAAARGHSRRALAACGARCPHSCSVCGPESDAWRRCVTN